MQSIMTKSKSCGEMVLRTLCSLRRQNCSVSGALSRNTTNIRYVSNDTVNHMDTSVPLTNHGREVWSERLQELREYRMKYGHSAVPREQYGASATSNSPKQYDKKYKQLGNWVQRIRMSRKHGKLSKEKIAELDKEQFVWDVHETFFEEKLDALRAFRKEYGHTTVPSDYQKVPGLYAWMTQQRYNYRRLSIGERSSGLSIERIDALNDLGFTWDPNEALWNENLEELRKFKKLHGHCFVPLSYKPIPSLGYWVNVQRKEYKKLQMGKPSLLTKHRIEALEREDFIWDVYELAWNEKFQELVTYKEVNGNIHVPKSKKELRGWIARQRRAYLKFVSGLKTPMTQKRKMLLDKHFNFGEELSKSSCV